MNFFWFDPKKGLNFCDMIQRSEFFWYDPQNLTLFNITRRLEPFSPTDSKKWTFSLIKYDPKVWNFSDMTQRTEHFFECDSKNWTLFTKGLQELIFWFFHIFFLQIWTLFKHDSHNWTFFEQYDSLRLNPSFQHESKKMTHLKNDSKIFFLFAKCMTQRMNWIDRSWKIWLWELKFLKEKRTPRIEPFQKLTRWIELSVLHDPKNWTFFLI